VLSRLPVAPSVIFHVACAWLCVRVRFCVCVCDSECATRAQLDDDGVGGRIRQARGRRWRWPGCCWRIARAPSPEPRC
jgi:hypothetical protein